MTDDAPRPYGTPAQRTPVEFDAETGHLRIGSHTRPVSDPAESSRVYGAYLSLLYAVRGAQPGEQLALRSADLEALLLIVGDDPETIEQRLVALMGCTADEATALSRVLLRHRKLTATLGVAAGLSLGVVAVAGGTPGSAPAQTEQVQSAAATSSSDLRTPPASSAGASPAASPGSAASPSPATTSVVLVAAEAPVTGAAFDSDLSVDGGSGTAERQTATTGRRSVAAPTDDASAGRGPRTTPVAAAPAPVQPSPGTGPAGPEQPDRVDDVPQALPVVPVQPVPGATPVGPGDSSTAPVTGGDGVPSAGTTPGGSVVTEPTEPGPAEPVVPEPTEPVVPEPTEPVVPESTEPVVPEPTEPVVPEPAEPVPTEPTTPVPTPVETVPTPSEPVPTEPTTPAPTPVETVPTPSEPVPTEPAPAPPAPTPPAPAPTEPAPSDGGDTKKKKGGGGLGGVADGDDADKGKGNDKPA